MTEQVQVPQIPPYQLPLPFDPPQITYPSLPDADWTVRDNIYYTTTGTDPIWTPKNITSNTFGVSY